MQRGIKLGDGLLEFHFIGFHTGQPIGCGEQYIVVYIGSSKLPGLATVKRSHTSTCCIPWCLQVGSPLTSQGCTLFSLAPSSQLKIFSVFVMWLDRIFFIRSVLDKL